MIFKRLSTESGIIYNGFFPKFNSPHVLGNIKYAPFEPRVVSYMSSLATRVKMNMIDNALEEKT